MTHRAEPNLAGSGPAGQRPAGAQLDLEGELSSLLEVKGVTSASVVGADGVLVAGAEGVAGDLLRVAELVPSALGSSHALGGLLGDGEVSQTLVEFERAPVLLVPLAGEDAGSSGHVAVLTLASVADLGRVRFRLKGMLPRVAHALAAREPEHPRADQGVELPEERQDPT